MPQDSHPGRTGTRARASPAPAAPSSDRLVTFAARYCREYTDIAANRARNNIQESLRDLGADSLYAGGEAVQPSVEVRQQPRCIPLPDWQFTLGRDYVTRAGRGPVGRADEGHETVRHEHRDP